MKKKLLSIVLVIMLSVSAVQTQCIIKIDRASGDLSAQFKTTFNNARSNGNFWIGYSLRVDSDYQFLAGSCYYHDENNIVSLRDVLMNTGKFKNYNSQNTKTKRRTHGRTINIHSGLSIHDNVTDKETAVLFMYDKNSKSINDFVETAVCNLSLYIDLGNYPIYWLGEAENKNSLNLLLDFYKASKDESAKEELIPAIGIHTDQPAATSFLKEIIYGKASKDLRENSVMWLGFQNNHEAFDILKKIVNSNHSSDIREQAITSISFIQSRDAINELINIAKHNSKDELRKRAVYGLGNKAANQAEEALKNIIEDDTDVEIKKHAVYALANTSNNIVPYLIKIAKTHASLSIRKCAIFSLANMDDDRAVDALIEMAKNN